MFIVFPIKNIVIREYCYKDRLIIINSGLRSSVMP